MAENNVQKTIEEMLPLEERLSTEDGSQPWLKRVKDYVYYMPPRDRPVYRGLVNSFTKHNVTENRLDHFIPVFYKIDGENVFGVQVGVPGASLDPGRRRIRFGMAHSRISSTFHVDMDLYSNSWDDVPRGDIPGQDDDAKSDGSPNAAASGSYGVDSQRRFGHTSIGLFNIFGSAATSSSVLPTSLQSRGLLFPSFRRVKLKNAKVPDREVWQFRSSPRTTTYFDILENPVNTLTAQSPPPLRMRGDNSNSLPSPVASVVGTSTSLKPISWWYLLEDTSTNNAPPYVLGIGRDFARIYLTNSTVELAKLEQTELFKIEFLDKTERERAALTGGTQSAVHWAGEKLRNFARQMSEVVTYRSIRALLVRAAPGGIDPTITVKASINGTDQLGDFRLVLYAVARKFVKFMSKVNGKKINRFVGVWNENSELVGGYWYSSKSEVKDALSVIHAVARGLQLGDMNGVDVKRALVVTSDPGDTIIESGELYYEALKSASSQEYRRDMKMIRARAVEDVTNDVSALATELVNIDIGSGTNISTENVSSIFGLSTSEEDDDTDSEDYAKEAGRATVADAATKIEQPVRKVTKVYSQSPYSTCVLCSIGASMSIMSDKELTPEKAFEAVETKFPRDAVPVKGLMIGNTLRELANVLADNNLKHVRINSSVSSIKNTLNAGVPVIAGMSFDSSIFDYNKNLDKPLKLTAAGVLKHCVTIVGYDDADSTFTLLNSWGNEWGRNGGLVVDQDYPGIDLTFAVLRATDTTFGIIDLNPGLPEVNVGA